MLHGSPTSPDSQLDGPAAVILILLIPLLLGSFVHFSFALSSSLNTAPLSEQEARAQPSHFPGVLARLGKFSLMPLWCAGRFL